MNSIINSLKKVQLRQLLITFLFIITFFVGSTLGLNLSAQAAPITTPEASSYQVDRSNSRINLDTDRAEEASEGIMGSLQSAAETVRDRLNLDEPLPESTKDFIKSIKGEEVDIQEPRPSGKSARE